MEDFEENVGIIEKEQDGFFFLEVVGGDGEEGKNLKKTMGKN